MSDVTNGGSSFRSYAYDANGQKLRKISTIGSGTTTDYIEGIQHNNGTIDFIQTEEGRALNSNGNYHYEYTLSDHFGDTRLTFDSYNGIATTTQQTDSMPFGMEVTVGNIVSPKNEYLYNGKELQSETVLYDYGARFFDPEVARWMVVDPMEELDRRWSPYNYCLDNSIRFLDPDGASEEENENRRSKDGATLPMVTVFSYRIVGFENSITSIPIGIDANRMRTFLNSIRFSKNEYGQTKSPEDQEPADKRIQKIWLLVETPIGGKKIKNKLIQLITSWVILV